MKGIKQLGKKKLFCLIGILCVIIGIVIAIYFMTLPTLEFNQTVAEVEIHNTYDAKAFIKKVRGHDIDEVTIDASQVNIDQLGKYQIKYKIGDKEYILECNVVDKTAPTFEVIHHEYAYGTNIKAEDFVKDIKDETETEVSFKEDYKFDHEGEYKLFVVVEDKGGNKTEKEVSLKLIKDTEKPTLSGLKDFSINIGNKINYLEGVTAHDNLDKSPKIDVDSNQVNISKAGTYEVKYTVKDQSDNQNTYTKKVTVSERHVSSVPANGNKVMYLTFDDGPSANTAKILDVLDKYNAKATFFVTGNGQKYNYLIKDAHDRGHTIALHTYSHQYNKVYASVDAYFDDLTKVGNMVKGIIGYVPKYIRFPGGASNTVSRHYSKGIMTTLTLEVQKRGYQYYDWNLSSGDASGNNVAVSKLVNNSTSSHASNIMLLCHDTQAKSTTVQALPQIIEHYQALGYTFKGIDDQAFSPHQRANN